MNLLTKEIPQNCQIVLLSDTHEGNAMVHRKGLNKAIQYIQNTPNTYWCHLGDWIEAIMPNDKRYQVNTTQEPRPLKQVESVVNIFKPIASKCIVGLAGNHEFKLHLFGDLSEEICNKLSVPYGTWTCKVKLVDKSGNQLFKMFLTHGFRGAISSNAKDYEQRRANIAANIKRRLTSKAGDCLLMAMGHTHLCVTIPPAERLILADDGKQITQNYLSMGDGKESYIEPDRRWYANTGSFLKTYEIGVSGYAEIAGYDPVELGYVVVNVRGGSIDDVKRVLV